MDQVFAPFYSNLMVQDKAEYRNIVDHIVNVWDIEMVVPAHGDILRGKEFVHKVLSRHFGLAE
jgi:flavorubredoxin